MRKGFLIALCLMFLGSVAFAEIEGEARYEYSVNSRNNTGTHYDWIVPTTTVRPGTDKIIGYDCMSLAPTGQHTETWVSLFDSTDSLMTGECFGEQEGTGGPESIHDRWARGKKILNGISVRHGAFTDLTLYIIRK